MKLVKDGILLMHVGAKEGPLNCGSVATVHSSNCMDILLHVGCLLAAGLAEN